MWEKPRRNFKDKQKKGQKKTFYRSTPKKNISAARDVENELVGIYKQGQGNFGFVDTVNADGEKKW